METGVHKVYRLDNQPFAQIPREAIRNPRITQNAFRLLAYLMSHQHGYDLTYGQIERETSLGRYAINGAIQNLTEQGWLEVNRTKLPNGQFGAKAWYVMNPSHTSTTVGDSTVEQPHMGQPADLKNKTFREQNSLSNTPAERAVDEQFDTFWAVYPRKVEKLAAKKVFVRQWREHGADIMAGVHRLANDPNLPPKQYIPYPATWLNGGGWENEPYPVRELSRQEAREQAAQQAMQPAEESRVRSAWMREWQAGEVTCTWEDLLPLNRAFLLRVSKQTEPLYTSYAKYVGQWNEKGIEVPATARSLVQALESLN